MRSRGSSADPSTELKTHTPHNLRQRPSPAHPRARARSDHQAREITTRRDRFVLPPSSGRAIAAATRDSP
jgi:hypothetical protein